MTMNFHPLFAADAADPTGGATAVADNPAQVAGNAPPAPAPDAPGIAAPSVSPKPFAESAPAAFKKYTSLEAAAEAHQELLRSHMALLQKQQGKDGKPAKPGQQPAADDAGEVGESHMRIEDWQGVTRDYLQNGSVGEDALERINKTTGLPKETIADFLQYMKEKQDIAVGKANEILGGDVQFQDIAAWLQSGQSGISDQTLAAYDALSAGGDFSWLPGVKSKYLAAAQKQTTGTKPGQRPNVPQRTGQPSGLQYPGFQTRQEYREALSKAKATNDSRNVMRVTEKFKQTPQHVIDSWGPEQ